MIKIPPAALEAGERALWKGGHVMWRDSKDAARAAFLAMVEAWPGMNAKAATDHVMLLNSTPALILPLTEQTDDKA